MPSAPSGRVASPAGRDASVRHTARNAHRCPSPCTEQAPSPRQDTAHSSRPHGPTPNGCLRHSTGSAPHPLHRRSLSRRKGPRRVSAEKREHSRRRNTAYSSSSSKLSTSIIRNSKARVTRRQAFTPLRSSGLNKRAIKSFCRFSSDFTPNGIPFRPVIISLV